MTEQKQIEEMREMASIMTEAALSACEDIPLMPTDTKVCYNIPCHRCKETRLLVYKGYRKQIVGEWYLEKETYGRMLCSNCREEALVKHEYNDERKGHLVYVKSSFCPNCGARMKGANNEN